jgi:hypothetical protein
MAASKVTLAGHPVILKHIEADRLSVHTHLRLCPGREMKMRVGRAQPFVVTVVSVKIASLDESGPIYQIELVEAAGRSTQARDVVETAPGPATDLPDLPVETPTRKGLGAVGRAMKAFASALRPASPTSRA